MINFQICISFSDEYIISSLPGRYCMYYLHIPEAEGFRYGRNFRDGIVIYNFPEPQDTNMDKLAFGFMTWAENGTLVRVDSGISADYIEVKLVSF